MSENRTGKYLKYALGEILLVMVGILLALQVNNWNEERKLKIEEQELLINLSVSFNSKLNELENKNASRAENIIGINKLLYLSSNPDEIISDDEMFNILGGMQKWHTINEEFSIIDMLFSSGKINLLTNGSLKTKLISWPDKMEEMLEEQRFVQDLVTSKINPLINKYVSQTNIVSSYKLPKILGEAHIVSSYSNDFSGLLNDRNFESLISYKKLLLFINRRDSETLIKNAKSILELINQELEID